MPDRTPGSALRDHPLIRDLLSLVDELGLDLADMVIFGSGPLLAQGLRREIGDLDIVARGRTWELVGKHGEPAIGEINGAPIFQFRDGRIQFSAGWVSQAWQADELINRADVIHGLRFARLEDVLAYKELLSRPKDQADIDILRNLGM